MAYFAGYGRLFRLFIVTEKFIPQKEWPPFKKKGGDEKKEIQNVSVVNKYQFGLSGIDGPYACP